MLSLKLVFYSFVGFAQFVPISIWQNAEPTLVFTTAPQAGVNKLCNGPITIQTTSNGSTVKTVTSDLTINLSADANLTYFSDENCFNTITDTSIVNGNSTVSFYFSYEVTGNITLTASAVGYKDGTQTHSFTDNPFVWTGNAAPTMTWNTPGNWSGGSVPGANDLAIFDSFCSNCDPSFGGAVTVGGIWIKPSYTGNIIMNANSIDSTNGPFIQQGGTFLGSSGNLTVQKFFLMGGDFTAPSATLKIMPPWLGSWVNHTDGFTVASGATFNHNNGTLYFDGAHYHADNGVGVFIDVDSSLSAYDMVIDIYNTRTPGGFLGGLSMASGDSITVLNDLTIKDGNITEGLIDLKGNLYYECAEPGGRNCADPSYGSIQFSGSSAQNYDVEIGAKGNAFVVNNSSGITTSGATDFWISHLEVNAGSFAAPSGTLTISPKSAGQYTDNNTGFVFSPGTSFVHNNGKVKVEGLMYGYGQETYFFVDVPAGLKLNDLDISIDNSRGGSPYGGAFEVASGTSLGVEGDLNMIEGRLKGGQIDLEGNLTLGCATNPSQCTFIDDGTIRFMGTSPQTYSYSDNASAPRFHIDNASGVTIGVGFGDLNIASLKVSDGNFAAPSGLLNFSHSTNEIQTEGFIVESSGSFTHNNGSINFAWVTSTSSARRMCQISVNSVVEFNNLKIDVNDMSTFGGYNNAYVEMNPGETIRVLGELSLDNGLVLNGTIEAQGDVSVSCDNFSSPNVCWEGGTMQLKFTGGNTQYLNNTQQGTLPSGHMEVDKSANTLNFQSAISLNNAGQNFTITNGSVDMAGYGLTVNNILTIDTGATLTQNGGGLSYGSLVNNGTLNP